MSDADVKSPTGKVETKTETKRPRLYKVILLNDDYTPREFVVMVLRKIFRMGSERAEQVMMTAAHNGDLHAAAAEGMATAFVPRRTEHGPGQTTDLEADPGFTVVAEDFIDLADRLGCP